MTEIQKNHRQFVDYAKQQQPKEALIILMLLVPITMILIKIGPNLSLLDSVTCLIGLIFFLYNFIGRCQRYLQLRAVVYLAKDLPPEEKPYATIGDVSQVLNTNSIGQLTQSAQPGTLEIKGRNNE